MGLFSKVTDLVLEKMPIAWFCSGVNIKNSIRGYDIQITTAPGKLLLAKAKGETVYFSRRLRYFYFKQGISNRLGILSKNYMFHRVGFQKGDHIIDCGANIGEIGMTLKDHDINYHAFEPEEQEARCCDLNNFGGEEKTNRKALWKEVTVLEFYSKPESADSSIFPAQEDLNVLKVPATTIAAYIKEKKIKHLKLAKIEAEGAEPEVLEGAIAVLHLIDYISVDCGFERGKSQASTFYECNQILTTNNFQIMDADLGRNAFLFKRRDL